MATMLDQGVYQVNLWCHMGDQASVNTLVYRYTNTAGALQEIDAANDVSAYFAAAMKALICTEASYDGIVMQRIAPAPRLDPVLSGVGSGNGDVANTPPLPSQVCGLITKRTGQATRTGRGRMYVPFPAETDSNGGTGRPTAGYLTRLDTLAGLLTASIVVTDGVNAGALDLGLFTQAGGFFLPVLQCTERDRWATQRRRGAFGPQNVSPLA